MATIEKRGESYRIVASAGYGSDGKQIRKRITWTPSEGLTARQIDKELNRVTVEFENKVSGGDYLNESKMRFADFAQSIWNLKRTVYRRQLIHIISALSKALLSLRSVISS